MITYGDTGQVDFLGNPIYVGDEVLLHRPEGLTKCHVTKYNPKTNMMGVDVGQVSGWSNQKFSTPFYSSKFCSIPGLVKEYGRNYAP